MAQAACGKLSAPDSVVLRLGGFRLAGIQHWFDAIGEPRRGLSEGGDPLILRCLDGLAAGQAVQVPGMGLQALADHQQPLGGLPRTISAIITGCGTGRGH